MTFPCVVIPIRPPLPPQSDAESAYRESCWAFLRAAFNGAREKRLWELSEAIFEAKEVFMGQVPPHARQLTTADPRPSTGTNNNSGPWP